MCVTVAAASHRHKISHCLALGYLLRLYARRSVFGIAGICSLLSGVIYHAEAAADTGPAVLAAGVARSLIQKYLRPTPAFVRRFTGLD